MYYSIFIPFEVENVIINYLILTHSKSRSEPPKKGTSIILMLFFGKRIANSREHRPILIKIPPSPRGHSDAPSDWYLEGHELDPQSGHISFVEIWSWNSFSDHCLDIAIRRRTVVSYWRKFGHLVLVNRLGSLLRIGKLAGSTWP